MFCPFYFKNGNRAGCEVALDMNLNEPKNFPTHECTGGSFYDCPLVIDCSIDDPDLFRATTDNMTMALVPARVRHVNREGGFRNFMLKTT